MIYNILHVHCFISFVWINVQPNTLKSSFSSFTKSFSRGDCLHVGPSPYSDVNMLSGLFDASQTSTYSQ